MPNGKYIYEKHDWPHFTWDHNGLLSKVSAVQFRYGLLAGRMDALGFDQQQNVTREALVQEVQKSSEIEGEFLNLAQIRSPYRATSEWILPDYR